MCGIVGYTGPKDLVKVLLDGLSTLEYRGYDSAGVALGNGGDFRVLRQAGRLAALRDHIAASALPTFCDSWGIGHTRWATHGQPNEVNAHPHRDCTGRVLLVHNGIIENASRLKQELLAAGHRFVTETDSEVIAHLVENEMVDGCSFPEAVRRALPRLAGAFSIVCVSPAAPGVLVAARSGPPLVVGFGDGEGFVASDIPALLPYTRRIAALADGEMAIVTRDSQRIARFDGTDVPTLPQEISWDVSAVEKGGFAHFMLKEIMEQPEALRATLLHLLEGRRDRVRLPEILARRLAGIRRVSFVACGTSWHAALVGKRAIERFARLPASVDVASEYRYSEPVVTPGTLAVFITQSGETADTVAALREARRLGALTLAITNVEGSMASREADATLLTKAGPEIGVASTKTFTTQLAVVHLLAVALGLRRRTLGRSDEVLGEILRGPHLLEKALHELDDFAAVTEVLATAPSALFIGRGATYPLALEGALKLKELTYVPAGGYAAGELKHGPIALVDERMPIVALIPSGALREKVLSNVEEVRARGGIIIAVTVRGDRETRALARHVIEIPPTGEVLEPLVAALPMQLLAYHAAVRRGCDVDKPRNLAKSVTVE